MGGPPAAHREVRRSLRVDRSDGWSPVAERRRQEPAYRPTHRHLAVYLGVRLVDNPGTLSESRSSHNSIRPQTSERPSSPPRRVRGGLAEAERHVTQWSTSTTSHSRWCSTTASTSTCDRPAPPSTSDQLTSSPSTDPHDRRPPPLGDRAASPAVRGETSSRAGLSRWGWSKKPGVSWAIESSTLMTAPAAAGGNVLVAHPSMSCGNRRVRSRHRGAGRSAAGELAGASVQPRRGIVEGRTHTRGLLGRPGVRTPENRPGVSVGDEGGEAHHERMPE